MLTMEYIIAGQFHLCLSRLPEIVVSWFSFGKELVPREGEGGTKGF